jgi:hypothetical protein
MFRNIDRRLRTVPHALTFTGILLAGLLATTALAQERDASRVALVIGNGAYKDAPLRNAVNDARSMSTRLTALGFEVITAENADRDAMQRSILKFASKLQGETTGLFYYAGHGIQSRGRNHLLPVDAKVASERALRFESVDVQVVLEEMAFAGNRINIVILDACRNNPFERRFRGGSRGLAAIDAARGTLVAYATAPGSVAADGDGSNGLYTSELLAALAVPNLKAEEVFKRVRVAVTNRTGGVQVPWESSSLTGDFVFNRQGESTRVAAAAPAATMASDHEALFWETINNSDHPDDYRAYLNQYPQGTFASLAQIRLSALQRDAEKDQPPTAADGPLKVAVLPFSGWHRWGKGNLYTMLSNHEQAVRYTIGSYADYQVVYVYDHDGSGNDPVTDPDRYWEGSMLDRTPNKAEVLATGRELGADIVFTYFFKRSRNEVYVAAYMIDVRTGEMVKRDTTTDLHSRGQASILTNDLLIELAAGG